MFHIRLSLPELNVTSQRERIRADVLLEQAAQNLAVQAHARIIEKTAQKLRSTRSIYVEALSFEHESSGAYVITLDKSAVWLEDGMPRHEMIEDLLRNGSQYSKKTGARYRVIPFAIKGKTQTPAAAQVIREAATSALRKAKINMKEIEKEVDGRIKQGTLHTIPNVDHPLKTGDGAFQGHGAVGLARQGMSGIPFLKGLRVMQRTIGTAPPMIQKTAMTFRVVSTLHMGSGRWVHPGIKPAKLFDDAYEWARNEWETKIKPEILAALE